MKRALLDGVSRRALVMLAVLLAALLVAPALLNDYLKSKGTPVHLLLSNLITHAEVNRTASTSDKWKLISFWANVIRQ